MNNTVIRELVIRGRHFTIVKTKRSDGEWYLSIEDKYITDGKINKALNGLECHANRTLNGCINLTHDDVEIDHIQDELGCDRFTAVTKYFELYKEAIL